MGSDNHLKTSETMPKVDLVKDAFRLKSIDAVYMKRLEQFNLKRAQKVQQYRKANKYTAITLSLTALGIYAYTIYSFKQESFLDDFNEPEKVIEKV